MDGELKFESRRNVEQIIWEQMEDGSYLKTLRRSPEIIIQHHNLKNAILFLYWEEEEEEEG